MRTEEVAAFLRGLLDELLGELAPARIFSEKIQVEGERLEIEGRAFSGPFYLMAVGKAAWDSAAALTPMLEGNLLGGTVLTRYGGSRGEIPGLKVLEAGHPIPDRAGIAATEGILADLAGLPAHATVIACVSGGGSALFEAPREGITLGDLERLNRVLLASGAAIDEINEIRKGVSRVKGGGLIDFIGARACLGLILSDVVGDDPAMVASGPTVPSERGDRWREIFERYDLAEKVPVSVLRVLEKGRPASRAGGQVHNTVLLGNGDLCGRAVERLSEAGFRPLLLSGCVSGEAVGVGRFLGDVARQVEVSGQPVPRPAALVTGGETTVVVRGSGQGGPNLETALSFARQVRGMEDVWFLSVDSDGSDGSTHAAGALVSGATWDAMIRTGADPAQGLKENDSLPLLEKAGCLVVTGPTGTNLNDLRIVLMP